MIINPATLLDGYKIDHRRQYCPGTELVFSNLTPRKSYRKVVPDKVVFFGLQYFIKEYLIKQWNEQFFAQPKDKVLTKFTRRVNGYLGPNQVGTKHIADLHDLGYLPLEIRALKEGSQVRYKVAPLVKWSTIDDFFWMTNYIETITSVTVWPLATTATTAKQFRDTVDRYAMETVGNTGFSKFAGHNFSYRGCMGHEAAVMVDAGWLTSFAGSDTVPGVDFMEEYYNANSDKELVSCSVAASEHSVVCSYGMEDEYEAFRHLIQDVYPSGIVSMISDSFDYWRALTEYTVRLKSIIEGRDGKVVFRPDSGDNVKVIIGDENALRGSPEHRGTIEVLWDIFGGTTNSQGYKELNPKVGAILGDGVTLDVMERICAGLRAKRFATTNLVYGVGSYALQGSVTRDTDGYAVKSTYCKVNGQPREIFKDPKTDKGGLKKSAKGLIAVYQDDKGEYYQKDRATWEEVLNCAYEPVFKNGKLLRDQSLNEIRGLIHPSF